MPSIHSSIVRGFAKVLVPTSTRSAPAITNSITSDHVAMPPIAMIGTRLSSGRLWIVS